VKKRNSSSGGAALHLGSGYQVRIAGWLAAEMLSGGQAKQLCPGGAVAFLRGETKESVDDLLVGTTKNRYSFIQVKRTIDFSEAVDSDFGSVIDQMVRQVVEIPADGVRRPWTRELTPSTDRLLLVTSSRSSEKIKVLLRDILVRAKSLAIGQPLSDAAASDGERTVLDATIATAMTYWNRATGATATVHDIQFFFSLISVQVLDVETDELGEREALRTLGTQVIVDGQQEGAAWSSVLQACRSMVERRSGLNADELRHHLREDGIELKAPDSAQTDGQDRLLSQLQPLDFDYDISSHLAGFVGRAWVFPEIDRWLAAPSSSRVFWITGEAGVGKTALAAWLHAYRPEILAVHFCRFGHSVTTNARGAICSLAYQLSTRLPDYRSRLNRTDLDSVRAETNPHTLFQKLLITGLQGLPSATPVVILIDALDEATEHGRNEFADVISSDFVRTPQWLRLIVTSRPHERELNFCLQTLDPWMLRADSPENIADLRAFLYAKLPGTESQAIDEIIARSEGLFLYVDMVCREIQDGRLSLDRMHEFPRGLGGVYAQYFRRYFSDEEAYRSGYRSALELICAAREPLTLDDLAGVLDWSVYEKTEIPAALGSLFPVFEGRIQPFHQSMRDWLITNNRSGCYFVNAGDGERLLANYGYSQYQKGVGGMARYFLIHLPAHLSSNSGRRGDLRQLLLDSNWVRAKLGETAVALVLADYAYLDDDAPARLIRDSIELSASAMSKDLSQFGSQMVGRLLPYRATSDVQRFIRTLIDAAHEPWLRPLHPALLPPGTELLRILADHQHYVSAVAVTPDGGWAVSGSYDTTLKLWDVEKGAVIRTMRGHSNSVTSVALFLNGRRAISASDDKTLKVWDLDTGNELYTLRGHLGGVEGVAVRPDGSLAVSASYDHTLRVWNLETRCQIWCLKGHLGGVRCVALSLDDQRAVSGSDDGTLKLWDLATGQELRTLEGHSGRVRAVDVSPDGQKCVSGADDNTVVIWDLETGCPLNSLKGHTSGVSGVALTSEGRRAISVSDDSTLRIWDLNTSREVRMLRGHSGEILGVAVTSDGHLAISASRDSTLKVWNLKTNNGLRDSESHLHGVNALAVTPDGRWAVTGSYDTTLKLWDVETGLVARTLKGHTRDVSSVAVTPDGRRAISASWDGTLRIWDLVTAQELVVLDGLGRSFTSVAVSPDGQLAVSTSEDSTVRLWDLATGRISNTLKVGSLVRSVAFTPDGRNAVLGPGFGAVWDLKTGDLTRISGLGRILPFTVGVLVVAPDGTLVISAEGLSIHVYDLETKQLLRKFQSPSRTQRHPHDEIRGLAISQDGRWLVSAAGNWTITVWDLDIGSPVASFTADSAAQCCAFASPTMIVAGDAMGKVHLLSL
jgi:WD40 repeat protein